MSLQVKLCCHFLSKKFDFCLTGPYLTRRLAGKGGGGASRRRATALWWSSTWPTPYREPAARPPPVVLGKAVTSDEVNGRLFTILNSESLIICIWRAHGRAAPLALQSWAPLGGLMRGH